MLPLSFSEFTDFCGVEFASGRSVGIALGGEPVLFDEMLTRYPEYGGHARYCIPEDDPGATLGVRVRRL